MVDAFEALVSKLMRDVSKNEPGAIYDVRRIRGPGKRLFYILSLSLTKTPTIATCPPHITWRCLRKPQQC